MSRFQPPNSLIFLVTLFRPRLLRPDIRVPHIGHVDYPAFRRAGFNAVVIDKDNCLTIPERDELYPPLQVLCIIDERNQRQGADEQNAWTELLAAVDPGKVLIVSNSAGTKKDPGGLAVCPSSDLSSPTSSSYPIPHYLPGAITHPQAESVTRHLRAPVLMHPTPKPACSALILQYFRGELRPEPPTLVKEITERNARIKQEEWDDKDAFVRMFTPLAEGKLLGANTRKEGGGVGGLELDDPFRIPGDEGDTERDDVKKKGGEVDAARDSAKIEAGLVETPASATKANSDSSSPATQPTPSSDSIPMVDPLRILVIGDRLFTDTLLANRLRATLGPENVVSIHTTLLPQPSDVRFLRWLESRLSRNRLREGREDWGRYVIRNNADEAEAKAEAGLGWRRYIPFRREWVGAPELGWRMGTWSFWGVIRSLSRGVRRIGRRLGRGVRWAWVRGAGWVSLKREARRAEVAAAAAKLIEVGGEPAVATAGGVGSKIANVATGVVGKA